MTVNKSYFPADNSTQITVTVTLKDSNGTVVSGKSVALTSDRITDVITASPITTNSSGQSIFTLKSSSAAVSTLTATDSADSVTLNASATSFVAPSISTSPVFWIKADSLSGSLNNGDTVVSLNDFGTLGLTLNTATSSPAVTYQGNLLNSHAGLQFADSGDDACAFLATSPTLLGITNENTAFVVKDDTSTQANSNVSIFRFWVGDFLVSGLLPSLEIYRDKSANDKYINGGPGWSWAGNNFQVLGAADSGAQIGTYRRSDHVGDTSMTISRNGGAQVSSGPVAFLSGPLYDDSSSVNYPPTPCIGAARYVGKIYEIIIYNTALSASDVSAVECYLNSLYNISINHAC